MYVQEVLEGHDERCKREFRMETHVFKALVKCLKDKGLILDTKYVSAEEQVAMFLFTLSKNASNRSVQERFQHSGETVSRHFRVVLEAITQLTGDLIQRPLAITPSSIRWNSKFYPYFEITFTSPKPKINFFLYLSEEEKSAVPLRPSQGTTVVGGGDRGREECGASLDSGGDRGQDELLSQVQNPKLISFFTCRRRKRVRCLSGHRRVRPWSAVAIVAEKSAAPLWTAAATVAKMSAMPLRTAAATVVEMSAAPLRTAAAIVAEMSTAPLRTATATVAEMSAADEVSVAASAAAEVSAAASAAVEVSAAEERVGCGEGGLWRGWRLERGGRP
ncbi:hypothetical protein ACMD2_22136 [Ananas comosus]|uniref:DUF8040 domain-containing protein n=1 Tax=Ananas comosus TaxID=4615 RepID=A0A199UJE7_ANACO|nr:hypothetical protein ACMD2_22136 [Ananas comosus]